MAIGLDKDCSQGRVYWSDISNKQIVSVKYDGTDRQVFISEGNINGSKFDDCLLRTKFFFPRYHLAGGNCR